MLTWLATDERVVMVDAALLGEDWRGWDASPDGHVLAPLDVARRADGHDVALPVCTERVADLVSLRRAGGGRLADGEAVTVGVSLLRGCAELLDHPDASGEWWLTETGRPVFAADASPGGLVEGTAALLSELGAASPDGAAWTDAVAAITAARPSRDDIERAEHGLFRLAEPLPLTTSASPPRMARDLARLDRPAAVSAEPADDPGLWHALARHVDSDLADVVSRVTTSVWRRLRARDGSRRTPWLVGGAAAAAVLAIGLMWPSGGIGAATADSAEPTPGASESRADQHASTPAPTGPSGGVESEAADDSEGADADPASVAAKLLDRRLACDAEVACLRDVMIEPSASVSPGPIDLPRDQRAIVLLDDFGGVAVLRVDAVDADQDSQLVVIARIDDEWLLRDVHDTAQQP